MVVWLHVQMQLVSGSENLKGNFKFWRGLQFPMQKFKTDSITITNLHGN